MVKRCVVCRSQYKNGNNIHLHSFPTEKNRRSTWELACRVVQRKPQMWVCSLHFTRESYLPERTYGLALLHPSAVPSIFPWNQSEHSVQLDTEIEPSNGDIYTVSPSVSNKTDETPTPQVIQYHVEDSLGASNENMPCVSEHICARTRVGDLTVEDFSTPRRAQRNLSMMKAKIKEHAKQKNLLQNQNRRLTKKLMMLKNLMKHMQERRLSSENAVTTILVIK